jgi:hypothetical protein
MPGKTPFRLNRSGLLLALISTAFAGQAQAAAGRVEFAIGPAMVVGADGRTRPAARGTEVDAGDTVRTQQNARVQVRMADGAYISLQPNTEFGIKDYKFEGKTDGSENAFYSLLKGAMRTATVGIRGTGGVIQVQDDGSTLVQGTSGVWFLANPSGTIDIPAGVSGVAPSDPNQPPQETTDVPTSGPAPLPPTQDFSQGEQRNENGTPILTAGITPLPSGSGYWAEFAFAVDSEGRAGTVQPASGSATFDAGGRLTAFETGNGKYELLSGSVAEVGADGVLAWGRWVGTVSTAFNGMQTYESDQGFHYVVGLPTPRLPVSGGGVYTLAGATAPTYINGGANPGTFSGTLTVNFASFSADVIVDFSVAMPGGRTYGLTGNTNASTASFALSPNLSGCVECSSLVQGFFAGSNAERVGIGYHIVDFDTTKEVVGAAAFKAP